VILKQWAVTVMATLYRGFKNNTSNLRNANRSMDNFYGALSPPKNGALHPSKRAKTKFDNLGRGNRVVLKYNIKMK
jgi:hypothetical protein